MKSTTSTTTLFIFLILNLNTISAQSKKEGLTGSWVVLSVNNKIADHWSIPTIGILRHYKLFDNYEFSFIRSGLTYHTKNNSTLTIGAAYLDAESYTNNAEVFSSTQFWVYEEFARSKKLKNSTISNRVRLETRWIYKENNKIVNNRLRYRLLYKHSIYKDFYISAFNEFFFNLEAPHFNQNRFFSGLGYSFSKKLKIELGYLKNHFKSNHYNRLRIAILIKNDFTESK